MHATGQPIASLSFARSSNCLVERVDAANDATHLMIPVSNPTKYRRDSFFLNSTPREKERAHVKVTARRVPVHGSSSGANTI